jgi:elongation factor P
MIDTADLRNGTIFEYEDSIWQVAWFQHHKPGKGGAMVRLKLRNMRNGSIIERTIKSGEKFREVELVARPKQFLYSDQDKAHFMDTQNYEQLEMDLERLGDQAGFLMENMEVMALYLDGELLNIQLPANVQLKVTETVPGVKGDSATGKMKPATLETGLQIDVPLFIKEGDMVKVDTRSKEYVERV